MFNRITPIGATRFDTKKANVRARAVREPPLQWVDLTTSHVQPRNSSTTLKGCVSSKRLASPLRSAYLCWRLDLSACDHRKDLLQRGVSSGKVYPQPRKRTPIHDRISRFFFEAIPSHTDLLWVWHLVDDRMLWDRRCARTDPHHKTLRSSLSFPSFVASRSSGRFSSRATGVFSSRTTGHRTRFLPKEAHHKARYIRKKQQAHAAISARRLVARTSANTAAKSSVISPQPSAFSTLVGSLSCCAFQTA